MDQVVIAIREYILPWLQVQNPGALIFLDNEQKDTQSLPDLYYELEVMFYGSAQIGMAASPGTRHSGFVYLTAFIRQGSGVLAAMRVLQEAASHMGYAGFSNVQLKAPSLSGDGTPFRGWHSLELKVPFYADIT